MASCLDGVTGCSFCHFKQRLGHNYVFMKIHGQTVYCWIASCISVVVEPDLPSWMPAHISLHVLMSWHWLLQQLKNRLQAEKISKYRNLKSRGPILAGYGCTKPYLSYCYTDLCDLGEGESGRLLTLGLFWLQKSKLLPSCFLLGNGTNSPSSGPVEIGAKVERYFKSLQIRGGH